MWLETRIQLLYIVWINDNILFLENTEVLLWTYLITLYCVLHNYNRNVEELIRFPDVKAHRQLTYGAKQLIAREVKSF